MSSLSEFSKNYVPTEKVSEQAKKDLEQKIENKLKVENVSAKDKDILQEKIQSGFEKYKDYDENQLLNEFLKQIDKQKKDGTFNYENLKNSVNGILPFLNDGQKQKIFEVLNKIR